MKLGSERGGWNFGGKVCSCEGQNIKAWNAFHFTK